MANEQATAAYLPHFQKAFSKALQELLQGMHLYQSVSIDGIEPFSEGWVEGCEQIMHTYWHPEGVVMDDPRSLAALPPVMRANVHSFALPQIKLWCTDCGPAPFKAHLPRCRSVYGRDSLAEQSLLLSYECQECSLMRIMFLVTRKGEKMQMCGRDPIETLVVPSSLPRAVARFYSEAQIAHRTGQALASLFLLREFIEQFWRLIPEVQEALFCRPMMDPTEIAEVYSNQLPLDFKIQYPNLLDCHQALTEAIEGDKKRPDVFEFCSTDIVDHLDGRRFRRLAGCAGSPFGEVRFGVRREVAV
jgi:hypothetical protein